MDMNPNRKAMHPPNLSSWEAFQEEYAASIRQHEIMLNDKALQTTGLYFFHLLQAQQTMNLTAYRSIEDMVRYHLLDVLRLDSILQDFHLFEPPIYLLDVGSGCGVPGLLLAALHQDTESNLEVSLLESVQKKALFLQKTTEAMKIKGVVVYNERAETLAHHPLHREHYHFVTARALAALPQALELTAGFLRVNGGLLLPRGARESGDISEFTEALLGVDFMRGEPYTLPGRLDPFQVCIYRKVSMTDPKYPRKPGKVGKNLL